MGFLLRWCDLQGSVLGGDSGEVVPLEVACLPVVQVDCFTEWIVPGVENSSVVVKFAREDQLQFWLFTEGGFCYSPTWGIWVNEAMVAWKFRDLESQLEVLWNISSCARKTYNSRSTGPATVGAIIKG